MNGTVLTSLYTRGVNGLPVLGNPSALAEQLKGETRDDTARAVIRLNTVLCGGTGFVCGVPGYASMPLTIPTNIGGVLLLQLHMTATIATVFGHDVRDDETQATCIRCVLNNSESVSTSPESPAWPAVKRIGVKMAERGFRFAVEQGVRLVRASKRTRGLPLIGGVVGGLSDGYATRKVGQAAQRIFSSSEEA